MEKKEFGEIRRRMGKTQAQMAQMLSSSVKAVQSFEQGLRKVPVHIERQLLFLLVMMNSPQKKEKPCWELIKCPIEARRICPAWEFQIGNLCWFINGTICHGTVKESWQAKMKVCRKCKVLKTKLPSLMSD